MLYVAYGSNINADQMYFRIPGAKPYGTGYLRNWRLDFHGIDGNAYATIIPSKGDRVPVVLWELPANGEKIMDGYEGYPVSYYKKNIQVYCTEMQCKKVGLVYIMNEARRVARPSRKYVNTIRNGYYDFELDVTYLEKALADNSTNFYLDDTLEIRDLKPINTKKKTSKKSYKKVTKVSAENPFISGSVSDSKLKGSSKLTVKEVKELAKLQVEGSKKKKEDLKKRDEETLKMIASLHNSHLAKARDLCGTWYNSKI